MLEYEEPLVIKNIDVDEASNQRLEDLENDEYKNKIFNREYIVDNGIYSALEYPEYCWLFENHFDVFGLIEKGLAIDINTLKN